MSLKNVWDHIAEQDIDDIKEAILAGYRNGKPFVPDEPRIQWPIPTTHAVRALDFGCGLGRNWPMLLQRCSTLLVYDRWMMLRRAWDAIMAAPVIMINDPARLQKCVVDVVYTSLVLQHIDVADALHILPQHRFLHVIGRGRHDDGPTGTFSRIPEEHYEPIEIAGYPMDLWPVIRDDRTDAHYEVLFERRDE